MNTTKLIFAVPILLAMLGDLDGYAIETSEEANEKIGPHEIFDRANCPMTMWSSCTVEGERCERDERCSFTCKKFGSQKLWLPRGLCE